MVFLPTGGADFSRTPISAPLHSVEVEEQVGGEEVWKISQVLVEVEDGMGGEEVWNVSVDGGEA